MEQAPAPIAVDEPGAAAEEAEVAADLPPEAEAETMPPAEPLAETEPETCAAIAPEAEAEMEPAAAVEPVLEAPPKVEPEPAAESEPEIEAVPVPEPEPDVVSEPAANLPGDAVLEVAVAEEIQEAPEPKAEPEPSVAAEPVLEAPPMIEPEPLTETIPEAAVEPEPEEPAVTATQEEAEPEPAAEIAPLPEPVEETPAPLPAEIEAIPEAVIEPDPDTEPRVEAAADPIAPEAGEVIAPEPEPVPEAESEDEAVAVVEVDPEPEPAVASAPEPEPVAREATIEPPPPAVTAEEAPPQLVLVPPTASEEKAAAKLVARQKMLDESAEQSPFSVIVGQVYDGPLDLLLDLIRKQDIDIYDIPIARITSQFLAYVNQLKATDVDVAGEFIYTASLLIHIKSKMLLPRAQAGPDDPPEDPRRELVERLLEHERFKNAAQMLQQKQMLEAATWTNPGAREFKDDESTEPEIAADTVDLVRIFRDILERARKRPVFNVEEDSVTVGQMIQFLGRRLTMEDKPVALRRLLSHTRSERALIAMFLALLELVRLQAILLRQDKAFSEIFVKKHTGFDAVMNEGLANARDDWR